MPGMSGQVVQARESGSGLQVGSRAGARAVARSKDLGGAHVRLFPGEAVRTRVRAPWVVPEEHDATTKAATSETVTRGDDYWEARLWLKGVVHARERVPPSATGWRRALEVWLAAVAKRFCATRMEWTHPSGARSGMWRAEVSRGGEDKGCAMAASPKGFAAWSVPEKNAPHLAHRRRGLGRRVDGRDELQM